MNIMNFFVCFFLIMIYFQALSSSISCERIDNFTDQHPIQENQLHGLSDKLSKEEDEINGGWMSKAIVEHVKRGHKGKGVNEGGDIYKRPKNGHRNGSTSSLMNYSAMSMKLQLVIFCFICLLAFLFSF